MRRFLMAALAALLCGGLVSCGVEEPVEEIVSAPPETAVLEEVKPGPADPPAPPESAGEEPAAARVEELLSSMTLEEKVGQLFFARCPAGGAVEDVSACHLGGYLLFGRDFQGGGGEWLTAEQFTEKIAGYQAAAGIPLLIGVDEEGGTVVRASRNPNLFPDGKCRSPQWLLANRGEEGFAEDAREKNGLLLSYGINVNLAPVCDVSTAPGSFIYDRTLGQDARATADYVERVAGAMRDLSIGSVLKHFPGYGDNADTHTGVAVDDRPLEQFTAADFLPFQAGIAAGAGTTAVLVSHNIVCCMDGELPASLSPAVHKVLRETLEFNGVVMTDDLDMKALKAYGEDGLTTVMALEAGNDLLITAHYRDGIEKILEAVENGRLSEAAVEDACRRVLTWKQALGLLP